MSAMFHIFNRLAISQAGRRLDSVPLGLERGETRGKPDALAPRKMITGVKRHV